MGGKEEKKKQGEKGVPLWPPLYEYLGQIEEKIRKGRKEEGKKKKEGEGKVPSICCIKNYS